MSFKPIDFYFDPTSPYAYLASTQIDELAARHGRTVDWRPMLVGVAIMQVMGLKPLPQTPLKGPYSRQDKHRLAKLLGVPLRERDANAGPMSSPVQALRAFLWIKQRDSALAVAFAKRLAAGAWVHGQDIDEKIASALAEELGIDAAELAQGIKGEDVKAALRDEVDLALSRGVFGVPFFFIDDEPFWGVDRLWMMEHWLRHGRWDHDATDRPCALV